MSLLTQEKSEDHKTNRQKILNAAEALFARNGFDATSLRAITTEAGVNIALVNYYFQTKDRLIIEVLSRAVQPLNQQRLQLLTQYAEASQPHPPSLRQILDAMIRPCLELNFDPQRQQVTQLLVRSLSEAGNFIHELIEKEWRPVDVCFIEAFKQALPHLPEEQILWRMHFTIGSIIHATCHHCDLETISQGACAWNFENVLNQLINYAEAGMQAPIATSQ